MDDAHAAAAPSPGVRTVYVLHHVHPMPDGDEDAKLIGVYSHRGQAEAAVARMLLQPGFRDCPDGFTIDPYALDEDHWTEGFVTVRWEDIPELDPRDEAARARRGAPVDGGGAPLGMTPD